jgi:F-type H+-transporting ATPase subunit epsilon
MAEKTIRCKLITRKKRVLDAQVKYASVPLWDGKAGFMAESAPFVARVGYGRLRVDMPDGGEKAWFIDAGFMQCVDNTVTILASDAVPVEELNAQDARAELAEANARRSDDPREMDKISRDRERARAKVAVIGGM